MSDKTTAALAAEQADVEATTTQEPELLPAATLDELEQVDLGTVAEGERAPFRITDDRCADWAIRKIADERSEYDRLKALADEQIAAINEKVAAARKRMENGTSYLTSCLADFFATVPHKETKTTEKYRLLSGTLTFKKGTTKTKLDEAKLVPWLKANGYGELVKVEESTRWADLKKLLSYTGDIATLTETGEIVDSYLICDGAVRSGKTSLMMVGFVDDAMTRFNGQRFGICGKTVDSATKNIVQPYTAAWRAVWRSWNRGSTPRTCAARTALQWPDTCGNCPSGYPSPSGSSSRRAYGIPA